MDLKDTLLAFSEWLDTEGIVVYHEGDERTHDDLAREFIEHWESDPHRATLAGRDPVKGVYAPGEPVLPPTRAGVVG